MIQDTESPQVQRALRALLAVPEVARREVQAVWLFGSHARGEATDASDVDLAVLASPPLGLERVRVIDAVGRATGGEVDVIDLSTAPPALAWEILTSGRLVFEQDERAAEEFVRRARFAADDAAHRDRLALLAQVGEVGGRRR